MQPTLPSTKQHQTVPNSYQQNQNNQTVINPANTATNFSGNSYENILLQTANAEVIDLGNRNSEKCNILFDSDAQSTCITKSLSPSMGLTLSRWGVIIHEEVPTRVRQRGELN